MRRASVATGLALTAALVGCHRASPAVAVPAAPSRHFALILERSASGWAAHCEVGCRWADVTMSCGGCQVRIDAAGIGAAGPIEGPPGSFAFVLRGTSAGWEAEGISGVHWRRLSWGCGAAVCRARIDETGVGAP